MAKEAFCPEHGPYDAALGACPYPHAGGAARGHAISNEDDVPTDLGYSGGGDVTPPTLAPGGFAADEGETDLPQWSGADGGGFGQEPITEPPLRPHRDDITELEVVTKGTLGTLWVKEGPRRGRIYPIQNGTTVGRRDASLILDDPKVSALHAKFTMEDEEFVIWDFGSSNGTLVNGKRIREATVLRENDEVKIGETVFIVKLLDPRPKAKPSAKSAGAPKKRNSKA